MSWTHTRARIARTIRTNPDADVSALRQQLKVERLAEHVRQIVATAPPLTHEQRQRVAALLTSGGAPDVG